MTWGQILLKNAPTTWKCCLHVKHPPKKIFWVFFSFSGVRSLYLVSGIMNPNSNIDVIQRKVMRDVQTAFPGGRDIFEQDLAPCHIAKKVKKVSQEKTNKRF